MRGGEPAEDALWELDTKRVLELKKRCPLATVKMIADATGVSEKYIREMLDTKEQG